MKIRSGFVSNSSSSSFVMIGFAIDENEIDLHELQRRVYKDIDGFPEKPSNLKERGCEHPETPGNFCSECGKPMWIDDEGSIDDWEDELGIFTYEAKRNYSLPVIRDNSDDGAPMGKILIGYNLVTTGSEEYYLDEMQIDIRDYIDKVCDLMISTSLRNYKVELFTGAECC